MLIDGGNEWFEHSIRRAKHVEPKGLLYMAMGVSGGEEGARKGPSLMPGGPKAGYDLLEPIITKCAAQTDSGPCTTYVGGPGAGRAELGGLARRAGGVSARLAPRPPGPRRRGRRRGRARRGGGLPRQAGIRRAVRRRLAGGVRRLRHAQRLPREARPTDGRRRALTHHECEASYSKSMI